MDFYAELALKPLTLTLGNKAIPDAKWLVFVIEKYKAFFVLNQKAIGDKNKQTFNIFPLQLDEKIMEKLGVLIL